MHIRHVLGHTRTHRFLLQTIFIRQTTYQILFKHKAIIQIHFKRNFQPFILNYVIKCGKSRARSYFLYEASAYAPDFLTQKQKT